MALCGPYTELKEAKPLERASPFEIFLFLKPVDLVLVEFH